MPSPSFVASRTGQSGVAERSADHRTEVETTGHDELSELDQRVAILFVGAQCRSGIAWRYLS